MEPSENYMYFIIEDGYRSGRICYTEKDQYFKKKSDSSLRVKVLNHYEMHIQPDQIKPLTKQEAEFLCALESDEERLAAFWKREGLDLALNLSRSSQVAVKVKEEWCQGVVRYIGGSTRTKYSDPITGTFFGIELQVRLCVCVIFF